MVGGPGTSFATSTKAGQVDAVHRFLQAYTAHFREAKSVSAEMLAHRAHPLSTDEATRHAPGLADDRQSKDHQPRSAAASREELRNSVKVTNALHGNLLGQTSRVHSTVTASGMVEQADAPQSRTWSS